MSVVGTRVAWTDEEQLLELDAPAWRKRWFVKPGLTGLAQINDAKSTDPNLKRSRALMQIPLITVYHRLSTFGFDPRDTDSTFGY